MEFPQTFSVAAEFVGATQRFVVELADAGWE